MPNWVANRLRVEGRTTDLATFADAVCCPCGYPFRFESLVPVPEWLDAGPTRAEIEHRLAELGVAGDLGESVVASLAGKLDDLTDEDVDMPGWLRAHWGPSSNPAYVRVFDWRYAGWIDYALVTPWETLVPWATRAAALFPMLDIELCYCEPGTIGTGRLRFVNGAAFRHDDWSQQSVAAVAEMSGGDARWMDTTPAYDFYFEAQHRCHR